ncbi:MAG: transposase family protein, partial [Elusimicrobia bacterium]|nr:transposase family protein [Elusimicrobiota bacterium]
MADAKATPPSGRLPLPRLSSATDRGGRLRRPTSAGHPPSAPGKKTACGVCGRIYRTWYDRKTRRVRDLPCGEMRIYLELEIRRVDCRSCGKVKQEKLAWLADNPFVTKRFAYF